VSRSPTRPAGRRPEATLDECNAQLARFETIKKFAIFDKDFEVGDEMTPTLKVKRKYVQPEAPQGSCSTPSTTRPIE
jgi:long-subunit acyl-CoA synthetase (AMP-forming)